jgi:hypothetical protein
MNPARSAVYPLGLAAGAILAATLATAIPSAVAAQDPDPTQPVAEAMQRLLAQGAEPVVAWVDLDVRLYQEFVPGSDWGYWEVTYRHGGWWTFLRRGAADFSVVAGDVAMRGRNLPAVRDVSGTAFEICVDGHDTRHRTDFEPPIRVEPDVLKTSGEGDGVALWYGAPVVEMHHPGHGRIPRGECYTRDRPGEVELMLASSDLMYEGARMNDYGEFLLATLSWDTLVGAAEGRGPPATFRIDHQALGVRFEVHGSIRSREQVEP